MITHLKCKNFMGQNIDEDISQKTIYTGKNTVGKSTRANIIAITALGFSPFSTKTSKKPSDILDDFGDGKKMVTEFTCCNVIFERKFTRSEKGSVSNLMRVNKTKANKSEFAVALSNAGNPQIIDLGAFLKISDNEKINTLFKLYPPGADLSNLDSQIEKSKKKISRLNESITNTTGAIAALIKSKTDINLPSGTLAETQASIENLTRGVLEAKESLRIAEEKNAAELKAAETVVDTQAQADQIMADNTFPFQDEKNQAVKTENDINSNIDMPSMQDPTESIQKIIDTIVKTDCNMCAAKMVAMVELSKFKGGEK